MGHRSAGPWASRGAPGPIGEGDGVGRCVGWRVWVGRGFPQGHSERYPGLVPDLNHAIGNHRLTAAKPVTRTSLRAGAGCADSQRGCSACGPTGQRRMRGRARARRGGTETALMRGYARHARVRCARTHACTMRAIVPGPARAHARGKKARTHACSRTRALARAHACALALTVCARSRTLVRRRAPRRGAARVSHGCFRAQNAQTRARPHLNPHAP